MKILDQQQAVKAKPKEDQTTTQLKMKNPVTQFPLSSLRPQGSVTEQEATASLPIRLIPSMTEDKSSHRVIQKMGGTQSRSDQADAPKYRITKQGEFTVIYS
jgi:hypothetical protein